MRTQGTEGLALGELAAILRRRGTTVLTVTAVSLALGTFYIARLPDVYRATAVLYLDPGRMPRSFERAGLTAPKLSQVAAAISQEVLSRETLGSLIAELGLYEGPSDATPDPAAVEHPPGAVETGSATDATALASAEGSVAVAQGWIDRFFYIDRVARARKDIQIRLVRINGEDFVQMSVDARTPDLASRTLTRIADLIATKNRDLRLKRAQDVSAFIARELERAAAHLEEEEAAYYRFREANRETLPDRGAELLTQLTALKTRTYERKRRLDDARARQAAIEFRVASLGAGLSGTAAGGSASPVAIAARASPERAVLERELRRAETIEAELAATYRSPVFPDRLRSRATVEILRSRLAELDGGGPSVAVTAPEPDVYVPTVVSASARAEVAVPGSFPDPGTPAGLATGQRLIVEAARRGASPETLRELDALLAEVASIARSVDGLAKDQEQDLRETDRLEALRAATGPTQAKLDRISAAHEEARRVYRDLFTDWQDSEKFLAAERALRADQLRTIDMTEAPLVPAKPNRFLLTALAVVVSFGLGGILAYVADLRRQAFHLPLDVESALGVKVLGVLPAVPNPEQLAAGELFVVMDLREPERAETERTE